MARLRVLPTFAALLFVAAFLLALGQVWQAQESLGNLARVGAAQAGAAQAQVVKTHQSATVPQWLAGRQVQLPQGLTVNPHAAKHVGQKLDAWRIQKIMLEGRCTASGKWQYCGKDLYICFDPATGLVGGLFVVGNEIVSGFAAREGYWRERTIEGELNINNCGSKYAIH